MEKERRRVQELESYSLNNGYPKEELQAIIKLASNICDAPISLVDIIDEFNQRTIATYGDWEEKVIPRDKSICDRVVVEDSLLIINDVRNNKEIRSRLSEEDLSKIRFYAGAPLKTSEGHTLGALCVIDSRPRRLSQLQIECLRTLADEVMARLQLNKQSRNLEIKNKRLEKYATFLKNSADILCIIDSKTLKIVDVNEDVHKVIGFDKNELIGQKFINLLEIEQISLDIIYKWFDQNSNSKNRLSLPIQLTHKDGENKWFRCNFTVKDGQWFLTARDISKQKKAEDELLALSSKFEIVAKATTDLIYEMDWKSAMITWSGDLTEILGYPESDKHVDFDWWKDKVHPDDVEEVLIDLEKAVESDTTKWTAAYRFRTFDGSYKYLLNNSHFERDDSGTPRLILGALADVSELKKAEIHQKNLYRRIQHANYIAKLGYWEYDLNDQTVFWSEEMYRILNIDDMSTKPSLDFILESVTAPVRAKLVAMIDNVENKQKNIGELEHRIDLPDGEKKYLSHRGELKYSETGEPVAIVITTQDITKRKEIELNLSRSLKEKEVLLAEVHHRVKNNLAIISGLLEMELHQDDYENKKYSSFIRRSQMRIVSIAKLHELLYQSKSFTQVSFKKYIQELVAIIEATINSEQLELEFNLHIDEMDLNINQAIPCGLILNELINNAVKHAFLDKKQGTINVNFTESENLVEMCISDNGIGFPSDFDINENKNFGLTLVKIQTEQLGGRFSIEFKKGGICKVIFNKNDGKGSSSGFIKKYK